MKPLGRQYYMDTTGGKVDHKIRDCVNWWEVVCEPSKAVERRRVKSEIDEGIREWQIK